VSVGGVCRVCVVGAGALGSVYAARLARLGDCEVSLVARAAAPAATLRLEKVDDGDVLQWQAPPRLTAPPPDTDVILAFVRYEQLASLPSRVGDGSAPVVVLTPMMPRDHAALDAALPGRVVTGMPSVVSYVDDAGAIRYWLPRSATTYLEQRATPGAESELVTRLTRAGIRARLEPDVLARNVATTVSFIPLAMALDAAGGLDALLADRALVELAFAAAREGRELGKAVGKAEAWASTLLRFAGPLTLRMGIGLARSRSPEALAYAEEHFGRKLHAQNVAMATQMVELAHERGTPAAKMTELLARLRAQP
jgi:2-dehydropantoate 2-reductase